jgi:integrase
VDLHPGAAMLLDCPTYPPPRPPAAIPLCDSTFGVAEEIGAEFKLALDLVYSTGHRIDAILHLQWTDIDLHPSRECPFGSIRWRAEHDKIGLDHGVPIDSQTSEVLRLAASAARGLLLFPSASDASKPVDRRLAS